MSRQNTTPERGETFSVDPGVDPVVALDAVKAVEAVVLTESLSVAAADALIESLAADITDPIGVVVPGELSSFAQVINVSFGINSDAYTGLSVELVKAHQADAGLEPTGIVSGTIWAEVLPELFPGDMGVAVTILQRLLGVPVTGHFGSVEQEKVENKLGATVVRRAEWLKLINA
jgi:hypothetical protein